MTKNLLTQEEEEYMSNPLLTTSDRINRLLRVIPRKGRQGYSLFMQSIKEENTHIGHKDIYEEFLSMSLNKLGKYSTEVCMCVVL